jgi:aspartate aminotransferase-like enzyme
MTFGTFFVPGPTEVRPEILQAMTQPMISHRGSAFRSLFERCQTGLRAVFCTERPVFIATCSATGLMEAAIRNAPPGSVLACVNGAFSDRFSLIAEKCGRTSERYEVPWGEVHDPATVAARVSAGRHAVVAVVHSETSTGALNDVRAVSDAAHRAGAVCVIDSVSGIRGAELRFDDWGLDFVFTGSQKALALPPGLAFGVATERFLASGDRTPRGAYFDLAEFASGAAKGEAPNTPAISLYYALAAQLECILEEGIETAWKRHAAMAAMTYAWSEDLTRDGIAVSPFAKAGHRSPTVTAISLPKGLAGDAVVKAVSSAGITLGAGYGKLKDTTVRIGHMGDHTAETLDPCLAATAETLRKLMAISAP